MKVKHAYSFTLGTCDNPECGPHFTAEDRNGNPICEIIIPKSDTLELIQQLQAILYSKVTELD